MARLQILELPEGSGDDQPPFVLVVDQYEPPPYPNEPDPSPFDGVAEKIGARAVLVFEETIDIPANDVPVDPDGNPLFLKVHVEGEFEKFREQVQDEIRKAQSELRDAIGSPASSKSPGRNRCCAAAFETLGEQHADGCPNTPDA